MVSLEQIANDMGEKVINIWYQTGIKKAMEEGIPSHKRPDYLKGYLRQRYKRYHEENGKHGRRN